MGSTVSPEKLRKARIAAGLNQRELAERVGLSRASVQNWENGRHGLHAETLYRIAAELGVSMESLFNGHPDDGEAPLHPAHPPSGGEAPAQDAPEVEA